MAILWLLATVLLAPAHALEHRLQLWSPVFVAGEAFNRVLFNLEIHPRTNLAPGAFEDKVLIRPWIGLRLAPDASIALGYAGILYPHPGFEYEHRPFQQLQFDEQLIEMPFTLRTRMEERFLTGSSGVSLRLRQLIKWVFRKPESLIGPLASIEGFFNLNSQAPGPRAGFDQVRALVGVAWKPVPIVELEFGYLANYVAAGGTLGNGNAVMNHIGFTQLTVTPFVSPTPSPTPATRLR